MTNISASDTVAAAEPNSEVWGPVGPSLAPAPYLGIRLRLTGRATSPPLSNPWHNFPTTLLKCPRQRCPPPCAPEQDVCDRGQEDLERLRESSRREAERCEGLQALCEQQAAQIDELRRGRPLQDLTEQLLQAQRNFGCVRGGGWRLKNKGAYFWNSHKRNTFRERQAHARNA